jgi:quercetin dioxygenase-like cupin family protein
MKKGRRQNRRLTIGGVSCEFSKTECLRHFSVEHPRNFKLENNMKKIAVLFGVVLTISSLGIAAEQKESSKERGSKVAAAVEHKIISPSEMTWVDAPPGLPPGAKIAVLDGDPNKKGSFTIRLQSPDGYKVAPHTHPTAERITVISGTFHLGTGDKFDEAAGREMGAGSFAVMPAGMKHFAWVTGDTVMQIHGEGPFQIKYVNPADDPRNTKR